MGGAQPLAVTMNDGVALCVEVDPTRIERRIKTRYLDRETDDLDTALAWADEAKATGEAVSIGLLGNCAEVAARAACAADGVPTSSPTRRARTTRSAATCRPGSRSTRRRPCARDDPDEYVASRVRVAWPPTSTRWSAFQDAGAVAFDYGNNLRAGAELGGLAHDRAYAYPGFVPAFVRPLFCEGKGPFRWAALSGDPADILATDRAVARAVPRERPAPALAPDGRGAGGVPGAARADLLARLRRARPGRASGSTSSWRTARCRAPIVIGRDHLDSGSVASPYRETEAMRDGSDAIADWPILNALVNTAAGAHWVSVHHGGGVGIGYSIHAGMVVVADGTENARGRLERVLTTDPGMGVVRHADAGYERRRGGRERARGADPDAGRRRMTDRHIVAMGGGGFSDDDPRLDRYVRRISPTRRARGVLLPTASGDAARLRRAVRGRVRLATARARRS